VAKQKDDIKVSHSDKIQNSTPAFLRGLFFGAGAGARRG